MIKLSVCKMIERKPRFISFIALSVIFGLALAVSFPAINLSILPWISFIPLFCAARKNTVRSSMVLSYVYGLTFFAVLLYWLTYVRYPAVLGYIFLVLLFPFIFVLWLWGCIKIEKTVNNSFLNIIFPPCFWVCIEFLCSHGTFAFPWWSLGYSQYKFLSLIQIVSITGIYGISFLIILSNKLLDTFIFLRAGIGDCPYICNGKIKKRYNIKFFILAWGICLSIIIFLGALKLTDEKKLNPYLKIGVVQANFTQMEKENPELLGTMLTEHLKKTNEIVTQAATRIVVWPETILPSSVLLDPYVKSLILKLTENLKTYIVTGMYDWRNWKNKKEYNSVIVFTPYKKILEKYDKMHLVPFGERVPFRDFFTFSPALSNWLNKKVFPNDTTPGKSYKIFKTEYGKFSSIICFESMLPQISREMVRRGAQFILIVTNDAWFQKSSAPYQHLAMAVIRAVENRRYVIQSANTGVSAIINPYGRINKASGIFSSEIIADKICPLNSLTIYCKFGDIFAIICVIITILGIIIAIIHNSKKSRKEI